MNIYIFTIIGVSIVNGIVSSLLSAENNRMKKYVNFISGLICAYALLCPVAKIAVNAGVFSDKLEEIADKLYSEEITNTTNQIIIEDGKERICKGIKEALTKEFSLNSEDIEIMAKIDKSDIEAIKLVEINVILKNEATWTDGYKIKEYIEDLVGCNTKVIKN